MENNYLSAQEDKERKDAQALLDLIEKGAITVSDERKQELENQVTVLNALDKYRDEVLISACQNISSAECGAAKADLDTAYKSYFETLKPDDRKAYNDAYATYTKYYDGYKDIESLSFDLDIAQVEADREILAQRISENLGVDKSTADKIVLGVRITHDLAGFAAMIVGPNSVKDKNLHLTKEQMQIIKDAEKVSTAKPGKQVTVPRDLNEQVFWKQVQQNPANGDKLMGMNNDPRFPSDVGFQKMQATHKLPDGSSITIHYQYNSNTGKAYDMKIDSVKPKWPQPGASITDK